MYDVITLPNGLRVVGEHIAHFRSVSVGLWVGTGSLRESQEENGLSHFIEHMLFKGTKRRSARDIATEMDAIGGQLNAFTSKECTCFYAKVMDEHLDLAMDLLCDILLHSTLEPTELEKEKGVIIEEISMVEDSPEDLVHEALTETYFADHPLAKPILGPADNIRRFTSEDLAKYQMAHYRPENCVLSIAGNFNMDHLLSLVGKHLGEWTRGNEEPLCLPAVTPQFMPAFREKDIEQLHLCLGLPGFSQDHPLRYALAMMNNILGGGMSSRLFQSIREQKGMAYSVYSYPSSYANCGLLTFYAGTSPKNAAAVLSLIQEELAMLVHKGISKKEFIQARDQLKGGYILSLESTSSRMNALGRGILTLGKALDESEVLAKIADVTKEDVEQVAKELLQSPFCASCVGKIPEDLRKQLS